MLYVDGKEEGLLVDLNKSSPTLRGDPRVDEEQDRQQTYHVDYITSQKSSYSIQGQTHPIQSYQLGKLALVVSAVTESLGKVVIINTEMLNRNKDVLGDYDFSRSDKFYLLRIPTYVVEDGVVLYEMHLKDLTNNEVYVCKYRFKELKAVHETLEKFDIPHAELPPFPKTHFWTKTNNNPELIEKRRVGL
jgi:hypothetical protein